MKKYVAEFIGTFVLVLFGCGTAALSGGIGGVTGVLGIALAFGLSIVAIGYSIGSVSGCHVNPAVSFAMLLTKRMSAKDFVFYVIAQLAGALLASAVLMLIINLSDLGTVASVGLGQNGSGAASQTGLGMGGAIITEIILTFVFVLTVLCVTVSEKTSNIAALVIGLTLAFVHILGIPLTGTSVNPARSLAPAIFMGGEALSQVWVFIVAPLAGAALAALVYTLVVKAKKA